MGMRNVLQRLLLILTGITYHLSTTKSIFLNADE